MNIYLSEIEKNIVRMALDGYKAKDIIASIRYANRRSLFDNAVRNIGLVLRVDHKFSGWKYSLESMEVLKHNFDLYLELESKIKPLEDEFRSNLNDSYDLEKHPKWNK